MYAKVATKTPLVDKVAAADINQLQSNFDAVVGGDSPSGTLNDLVSRMNIVEGEDQTIAGIKTFSSFPLTPPTTPSTDYQVVNKKYVDDSMAGSIISTAVKTASYAVLDTDTTQRYEYDLTGVTADVIHTQPLMANNRKKRIEVALIKNNTTYKLIVKAHATDGSKISSDALAEIWLTKVGDHITVQESETSGYWEIVNENITSETILTAYGGYGTINTYCRSFTTNATVGCYQTPTKDGANYVIITLNRSGRWAITSRNFANGVSAIGVSINSNGAADIATQPTLYITTTDASRIQLSTVIRRLSAGSILKNQVQIGYVGDANDFFSATYIGQ